MSESSKLWGGRFTKELDPDAKQLSYSLNFDHRLAVYDIRTNLAHSQSLTEKGILTAEEFQKIEANLKELEQKFQSSEYTHLFKNDEDIHSCIERILTEKLGDLGKKIHTGKSRNDQVKTDMHLFLKAELLEIIQLITNLQGVLCELAESHIDIIFPGFTHFQPAQPVLLSHHLLAYYEQFARDKERFLENLARTDVCPLGAGALAGNNYGLDRNLVAKKLGLNGLTHNSMDAVSERDFMMEFLSNASICMIHLSRFCEELIMWSSPIFNFICIDDSFTTGSSIMPQKKNPDIAELIRGKTGRVMGNLIGLMTTLKALPLTYNRDLQEDKEGIFDTVDTLKLSLTNFAKMLNQITFNKAPIEAALQDGYLLATELADYLVLKGMPFRKAHEITGKVVLYAIDHQLKLEEIPLDILQTFCSEIGADVLSETFNYQKSIDRKNGYGGTAKVQVLYQIHRSKEALKS